jgi:3'-phosphoadenosine 5'-phosphosulfate sulfotransferase (PAPS reductase)/FAD synthetase
MSLPYKAAYELPEHPLTTKRYLSIGCAPCTSAVKAGEDARAGRLARSIQNSSVDYTIVPISLRVRSTLHDCCY